MMVLLVLMMKMKVRIGVIITFSSHLLVMFKTFESGSDKVQHVKVGEKNINGETRPPGIRI